MTAIENPTRHLSYLQQCLSSDKKPLGLFFGAGCSMAIRTQGNGSPPLIPDIAGITEIVRKELGKNDQSKSLLETIEQHFVEDERAETTVEDMLTHIRALRAVAGKSKIRDLTGGQLDKLDEAICNIIHNTVDKTLPNRETPYHWIASWVDAIRRNAPVEIFTINYDLLTEQAFEDTRVPYFDGFAGVRKPFFDLRAMEEDMLPPRWARLWKLHGSINWYQVQDQSVFRGTTTAEHGSKRVIHPSHLKYQESRRMPYLAMIDRLRAFLKQPTSTLVLCGYSFRDDHINEVIVQGLQSTQGAVAFALLHGNIETYPQATALAHGCANLSILARDGAVISTHNCDWPVKEAEAVSKDSDTGVKWKPCEPENRDGKWTAEFTLGDFAVFGHFLKVLIGNVRQQPKVMNAQ